MASEEEPLEYKGYRITVESRDGKYAAWAERLDGRPISGATNQGMKVGTHYLDEPQSAIGAAKDAIDRGEVQ